MYSVNVCAVCVCVRARLIGLRDNERCVARMGLLLLGIVLARFFFCATADSDHGSNTQPVVNPLDTSLKFNPSVPRKISPTELAENLRACVTRNVNRFPAFNVTSLWAGRVLEVPDMDLIVGPVIPKVASMDLRRSFNVTDWKKQFDVFRSVDEILHDRQHLKNLTEKLWFAVVRNPVDKLVSGYQQVAMSRMFARTFLKRHPACRSIFASVAGNHFSTATLRKEFPKSFCASSLECQMNHFETLFASRISQYELEHREAQMNWLLPTVPFLDAVVRTSQPFS